MITWQKLVINQNYDKYWKTDRGEIINNNGLLAVKFDDAVNSKICLQFRPNIFFMGAIISIITLLGSLIYMLGNHPRFRCRIRQFK